MKVFLDDERNPQFLERFGFTRSEYVDMLVIRTSSHMIHHVRNHGMPSFISFDHDLGPGDTSREFIKWMVDGLLDGRITLPKDFDFFVHSQNPVGAKWITDIMTGIIKELGQ